MTTFAPADPNGIVPVVGGRDAAAITRVLRTLATALAQDATPPNYLADPAATPSEISRTLGRIRRPLADARIIVQTSGSTTGQGNLVGLSPTNVLSSALATLVTLADQPPPTTLAPATLDAARSALPPAAQATWVTGLPVHHIAGLQVLTRSLLADTEPIIVNTAAGFDPAALAAAAERHDGATRLYTSLVPTQLREVVADPALARRIGERFDAILVGGAALPPATARAAAQAGLNIVRTYGMSETGGGCVYDGRALPGVQVSLTDVDAHGVGLIRLAGAMVVDGYLTDATPTNPRHRLGHSILTSDLGELTGGVLSVIGRADDVIITGGANVSPQAVEQLLSDAGLEGIIVGVPDPRWGERLTFVTTTPGTTLDQVRAALGTRPAEQRPRALVTLPALPERGPGKIDRRRIASLAAARLASGEGESRDPR